jgi:hypothetical protein
MMPSRDVVSTRLRWVENNALMMCSTDVQCNILSLVSILKIARNVSHSSLKVRLHNRGDKIALFTRHNTLRQLCMQELAASVHTYDYQPTTKDGEVLSNLRISEFLPSSSLA